MRWRDCFVARGAEVLLDGVREVLTPRKATRFNADALLATTKLYLVVASPRNEGEAISPQRRV